MKYDLVFNGVQSSITLGNGHKTGDLKIDAHRKLVLIFEEGGEGNYYNHLDNAQVDKMILGPLDSKGVLCG